MKLGDLQEQVYVKRIESELKKIGITEYTIHPDGTVDVDADMYIPRKYTSLPIKFGKVYGNVRLDDSSLTTLTNAPQYVKGWFNCTYTNITSLVGAPQYVGDSFYCSFTRITSLVGAPLYVGDEFYCANTPHLKAILPIMKIKGITRVDHEASEIIMRHYRPDGTGDIIALQDDLIEAGWAHIARLK